MSAALAAARAAAPGGGIGGAALEALREELETHPKPGLVTLRDRGAHGDMDAGTFLASLAALDGAFDAAARAGRARAPFATLRALGVEAEARMLRATGGVNTHRGAIFTLGLLAAAAGRLEGEGAAIRARRLRSVLGASFAPAIRRELAVDGCSHGAAVARSHHVGGARAEALHGFPHLFELALPALRAARRWGVGRRAAAVQCLMATMAELPDTNLLHRGGRPGLALARGAARVFVGGGGVLRTGWEAELAALHRIFLARDLSPGGSADLLAAALFVDRLAGEDGGAP